MPIRAARTSRGFSLLEALLAIGIILLALTFAARLLLESRNLLEDSSRRARDPLPQLALGQLRNDLQAAALVVAAGSGWSSGPLVLVGLDVGSVSYVERCDALERTVVDALGTQSSRRIVLTPIGSWRWREVSPGLVDVELVTAEQPRPRLRTAPTPLASRAQRFSLRAALRGGERVRSW